jgi:hypothetical protein
LDHLAVFNLPKVAVEMPDSDKRIRYRQADDFVGLARKAVKRRLRRHGHCHNEVCRVPHPRRSKSNPHRTAGCQAIIHHYGSTSLHGQWRPPAKIKLSAAFDFRKLSRADSIEVLDGGSRERQELTVSNDQRRTPINNSANCQFRLTRCANFANQQ